MWSLYRAMRTLTLYSNLENSSNRFVCDAIQIHVPDAASSVATLLSQNSCEA